MKEPNFPAIAARRHCYVTVEAELALKYSLLNAVRVTEAAILAGNHDYKKIANEAYEAYRWARRLAFEFIKFQIYPDGWFITGEYPYFVKKDWIFEELSFEAKERRLQLDAERKRK